MSINNFIKEIAPHAQRVGKEYNILASVIIAQASLESNYGRSGLATKGFNLFGIKGAYNGKSVTMKTAEYKDGKRYYINAAFRKYPSWYESLLDLANLYKNGVSWDKKKYHKVLGEKNYVQATVNIQKAGYATDPQYASKLCIIIEQLNLTQFDKKETVKTVTKQTKVVVKKTPVVTKPKVVTVKAGDTLSKLVGTSNQETLKKIAAKNGIKNIHKIYVGQKIKL